MALLIHRPVRQTQMPLHFLGRGFLKCINHCYRISAWKTITQHPEKERVAKLINDFGLVPLGYISYDRGNKVYISGIIERWQPETNTFHLPFGEIMITLENVWVLLGILVTSKTVVVPFKDRKSLIAMVSRLLEVSVTDADEEIKTRSGLAVSLTWLKDRFSVLKKGEEEPHRKRAKDVYPSPYCLVRAYLLYLLGATLFSNKSGMRVSFSLLQLLERVDNIDSYLWGPQALRSCTVNWALRVVIWDTTLKGAPPDHDIAFNHGPMKFMDIVEPHNPIRVLRQMEYAQRIPRDPYRPIDAERSRLGQLYSVKYSCNHRALDVALQFRCTPKANLNVDDAFQMADQVIAFLSDPEHAYQSTTTTASQNEGGTTSTGDPRLSPSFITSIAYSLGYRSKPTISIRPHIDNVHTVSASQLWYLINVALGNLSSAGVTVSCLEVHVEAWGIGCRVVEEILRNDRTIE
ncbi:hypothetical protein Scep_003911 [Stephania cephalantha]|uniref:Aminotransferase-like plant mobile domain-containing protein n=1 Tax=Stephania cephalantha TaxID=152367 RepID=A0AAP0KTB4_9MAGN